MEEAPSSQTRFPQDRTLPLVTRLLEDRAVPSPSPGHPQTGPHSGLPQAGNRTPVPTQSRSIQRSMIHPSFSFSFSFFKGCTCSTWKFADQESNWSCSCQPMLQPQQLQIQTAHGTYTTAHGTARALTHGAAPGIEPASSRRRVWFVAAEPQRELPHDSSCTSLSWSREREVPEAHPQMPQCQCLPMGQLPPHQSNHTGQRAGTGSSSFSSLCLASGGQFRGVSRRAAGLQAPEGAFELCSLCFLWAKESCTELGLGSGSGAPGQVTAGPGT